MRNLTGGKLQLKIAENRVKINKTKQCLDNVRNLPNVRVIRKMGEQTHPDQIFMVHFTNVTQHTTHVGDTTHS